MIHLSAEKKEFQTNTLLHKNAELKISSTIRKVGIAVSVFFLILGVSGTLISISVLHAPYSTLFWGCASTAGMSLISFTTLSIFHAYKTTQTLKERAEKKNLPHLTTIFNDLPSINDEEKSVKQDKSETAVPSDLKNVEVKQNSSLSIRTVTHEKTPSLPEINSTNKKQEKSWSISSIFEGIKNNTLEKAFKNFQNNPTYNNKVKLLNHLKKGASIALPKDQTTYLHLFLRENNWNIEHSDLFTLLIENAKNQNCLNYQDKEGNTPLHYVKQIEQAKPLIDAGALLNIQNLNGETILLSLCNTPTFFSFDLYKYLIEKSSSEILNLSTKQNETLLSYSFKVIDVTSDIISNEQWKEIFLCLLEKGGLIAPVFAQKNLTHKVFNLLYTEKDLFEKILLLAKQQNALDTQDEEGNTLLHKVYNEDCGKRIFDAGASLGILNFKQETPLHVASNRLLFPKFLERATIDNLLIKDSNGNLPFQLWVKNNSFSWIKATLSKPVALEILNATDSEGTLLHWAFAKNDHELATYLPFSQASLMVRNSKGETAFECGLKYFTQYGNKDLLKMFINSIGSENALYIDAGGDTWLHKLASHPICYYSKELYCKPIILHLIKLGVDPEAVNKNEKKAIDLTNDKYFFTTVIDESKPLSIHDVYKILGYTNDIQNLFTCLLNEPSNRYINFQEKFEALCAKKNYPPSSFVKYLTEQISLTNFTPQDLQEILKSIISIGSNSSLHTSFTDDWEDLFSKILKEFPKLLDSADSSLLLLTLSSESTRRNFKFFNCLLERTSIFNLQINPQQKYKLLFEAIKQGKYKEASLLIDKGAYESSEFKRITISGEALLILAIKKCDDKELLTKLFSYEVDKPWGTAGNTLLHFAAYYNNDKALEVLLDFIPHMAKDINGSTPLHIAFLKGSIKCIDILNSMLSEADFNCKDNSNNTFLHALAKMEFPSPLREDIFITCANKYIIDYLQKIDPYQKDSNGKTAAELLITRAPLHLHFFICDAMQKTQTQSRYFDQTDFIPTGYYSQLDHETDLNVLGLKATASKSEMKKAYNKLAMEYHPDKNQKLLNNKQITQKEFDDKTEQFRKVQEAYDKLKISKHFQ